MTTPHPLPPLPDPFDYCYEWHGPWGTRKFSAAQHNGRKPDNSVAIYTADQLTAYARQAVAEAVEAERARLEKSCATIANDLRNHDLVRIGASKCVAAMRNSAKGKA